MTLAQLRMLAKAKYGLEYGATEDPLFTNTVLNELINDAHQWLAAISKCYYNDGLATGITSGTAAYAVDASVLEVDVRTVRLQYPAATWKMLPQRFFPSLLQEHGPLEGLASGAPTSFYLRAGYTDNNARLIVLVPTPALTIATALKYGAHVYPGAMTADADTPELQASEHYRLIPAICMKMAELERSRGREDAPVEMWTVQAYDQATELAEVIRTMREPQRTASVGRNPLADAEERRSSRIGTVGGRPGR